MGSEMCIRDRLLVVPVIVIKSRTPKFDRSVDAAVILFVPPDEVNVKSDGTINGDL